MSLQGEKHFNRVGFRFHEVDLMTSPGVMMQWAGQY
jgi:hypothetical protein